MPSVKSKVDKVTNEESTIRDENFHKLLKAFQKTLQETKRQVKRHEHFLSARDEMRAKRSNAASKKKKGRK